MAQIVPAILEKTKEGFLDKQSVILKLPGVERIQVDFEDGVFVPQEILPVAEMDTLNPAYHWEAHLMVKNPTDFLDYEICGFKTIVVHYEAYANAGDIRRALLTIRQQGIKPGLCVNPDTPIKALKEFAGDTDHFQLMSVYPGYQGQSFIENTYERIGELRKITPNAIIEVDGGANLANIKKIARAGADLIICGSSIVKAPNPAEAYEKLNSEINNIKA
ncbi:MAG: hypothetical protein M1383_03545 [Patescibacteria group bacterium]|nr:hypothetical protein [Patescibacteria group bacterium]